MSAISTTFLLQDQAVDHIQIMNYINTACVHAYIPFQHRLCYIKKIKECGIFQLCDNMITYDARCTCEIKSRIAMAKAEFNKRIFSSAIYS